MTESSLILKEAKAVGMTFPDLLDRIVELALK
jgi:D-alanine-D-alanine ligase-like ATP-grasp enzyme